MSEVKIHLAKSIASCHHMMALYLMYQTLDKLRLGVPDFSYTYNRMVSEMRWCYGDQITDSIRSDFERLLKSQKDHATPDEYTRDDF